MAQETLQIRGVVKQMIDIPVLRIKGRSQVILAKVKRSTLLIESNNKQKYQTLWKNMVTIMITKIVSQILLTVREKGKEEWSTIAI